MQTTFKLEGMWESCFGDKWRIDGTIALEQDMVVVKASGLNWRLMSCPDTAPLQRWRNRVGEKGFEFVKGTFEKGVLSIETHNVTDSTLLGYSRYTITFNDQNGTFEGQSESIPETVAKDEASHTGEMKGDFTSLINN